MKDASHVGVRRVRNIIMSVVMTNKKVLLRKRPINKGLQSVSMRSYKE